MTKLRDTLMNNQKYQYHITHTVRPTTVYAHSSTSGIVLDHLPHNAPLVIFFSWEGSTVNEDDTNNIWHEVAYAHEGQDMIMMGYVHSADTEAAY